jgi:hypothetical protein
MTTKQALGGTIRLFSSESLINTDGDLALYVVGVSYVREQSMVVSPAELRAECD